MANELISEMERLIHRDPARRGLIGDARGLPPLAPGHLEAAAAHIANNAAHVGIVTGFYVPGGDPPAAETDGPPGAALLAATLRALDIHATLITDRWCHAAVVAAAEAVALPVDSVICGEMEDSDWRRNHLSTSAYSHLIAIERAGPSHTEASLVAQKRANVAPLDAFRLAVALASQNRCFNMRGEPIDEHTADLHRLFEELEPACPGAKSVGIGDGGNEIGMGAILWEHLTERLDAECRGLIPCRIATDWTIIAGTSNWGAYALAAAVAELRGRRDVLAPFGADSQLAVIERMVEQGPAVDGVTRRREATVDGLPFLTYIQPWIGIRRLLGLPD